MKKLIEYLIPYKGRMLIGLLIKIAGTVTELFLPMILTYILKNVVVSESIPRIIIWGVLMLALATLACALNIIANRMAALVSRNFSERVRKDLFAKTLNLSASQVDKFTIPSLEARITTDTYNTHSFINMVQRMGVRAPILLIGGIAITLIMDAGLSLIMIALLPFIFFIVYGIRLKGIPLYTNVQKSTDKMVRVVREDTQGMRVIKALSKNDYENRRYDEVNTSLSNTEKRAGTVMGIVQPIMTLLMNIGITAVVALAAYRVRDGKSDPETVIAFIQYFTLISMAMMTLSRIFVMYTKCAASADRISEVLNAPCEMQPIADEMDFDMSKSHISFKDVSFSYCGTHSHLENISFSLEKGQTLGIIGATGSGKSTIINLLLRFYDPALGSIKIYGKDIRSIETKTLRDMFGTALQNDFLYADTVAENISFGRDISQDDIIRAAKIAQAYDFISAFPDGFYHTIAQKGSDLSGGQKQRILIARAVAAKPPILILDDASSALDYKTDAALRKSLSENLSDSTVITVAQRVSSVKDCDLILVIDNGKIIGKGKHEELLCLCSEYKEISDSQMGGAIID